MAIRYKQEEHRPQPEVRRRGFTLIELLVVIAIIAILVALLLPAVQAVREAARRSQCQDHLHNLVIALHNYEGTHKLYPYGHQQEVGGARHRRDCWYQRILPFVEQKPLQDAYQADNTEYIHAINQEFSRAAVDLFSCPSNPDSPSRGGNGGTTSFQGNYAVCAGAGTGHTIDATTGIVTITNGDIIVDGGGMFGRSSSTNHAKCVDGTSSTLYLGEGISRGTTGAGGELGGYWGGAPHGAFGFSTGEVPNSSVPDRNYSCKMTLMPGAPNGAPCENGNAGGLPGRWNFARSFHPGGAHAALGDGKVSFFSENVDRNTWIKLGMRSDGLPVSVP